MSRLSTLSIAISLALAAALTACYQAPTDVTNYQPGVYKGEQDPLLAKQRNPQRLEELAQRFNLVQTDR